MLYWLIPVLCSTGYRCHGLNGSTEHTVQLGGVFYFQMYLT